MFAAPDAARCMAELAMASFGRIDAVIHNAGIIEACGVAELAEADLTRIFEVNTLSAFRLTQQVLPIMRDQNYGRIVFTTSTAALYGNAGLAAYAMAKAALIGLMHSVADEQAPYGIRRERLLPDRDHPHDRSLRSRRRPARPSPPGAPLRPSLGSQVKRATTLAKSSWPAAASFAAPIHCRTRAST